MIDYLIADRKLLLGYPYFKEEEYSSNDAKPVTKAAGDSERGDETLDSNVWIPEEFMKWVGEQASNDVCRVVASCTWRES